MTDEFTGAGDFAVNPSTREVRGLLVPYGETSRLSVSGVPPIRFDRGDIRVPRDVTIMNANDNHDRYKPVARFTAVEDTDKGVVGVFSIGNTPEGDAFLAAHARGIKSKLSPELRNIQRFASDPQHGTAELTGAGFVTEGAFATAGVFAVDDPAATIEPEPVPLATKTTLDPDLATGKLAVEASAMPLAVDVTVGSQTTTFDPAPSTESSPVVTDSAVPVGAFAPYKKGERHNPLVTEGDFAIRRVAEAMAALHKTGDGSLLAALGPKPFGDSEGLFALNDIKLTTAGSVGVNIINPQFVGNLWNRKRYERKYIPLWSHDELHSFKVTGWRPIVNPAMASWAGDKAAVPSNTPTTEPYSIGANRFAGGHDIAREFRDFDVPEFWEWYFNAMTDSYAQLSDNDAFASVLAGATANPTTAGAVPAGVNSGFVTIVDGALAIIDNNIPSYAIVAKDVYRSLLLLKDIDKLAYLNTAVGLENGTIESFHVVPSAGMANGKAIVGSYGASTTYELPGSPIRTEALDQIKGGVDEALFGYEVTTINDTAGLTLVTPAA